MNKTMVIDKNKALKKAVMIIIAVTSAVVLPQIFHAIGVISGTGAATGAAFLPMHIPVLLAGLLYGPIVGVTAGILSPIISFAVSGMPTSALLPYMVIELAVYGLTAGLLSKSKLPSIIKLLIVQISGRVARGGAVLFAIYALDNSKLTVASISSFVTAGLFGIALQWAVIPLMLYRLNNTGKPNE